MLTWLTSARLFRAIVIIISVFLVSTSLNLAQVRKRKIERRVESPEKREKEEREQGEKERRVDDPADEEELNRGLWEFARGTPYDQILPYVEEQRRKSRANQIAEVELPTGWRIAPAGRQVEVGRLPYEAISFAGKLVVLDTGNYYKEPQEVTVVDTDSGQVEKTLKINSLFPSAVIGPDADLYISGGFDQKVFRIDKQFNVLKEYPVGGFVAGIAPLDSMRLLVGYLAVKRPITNGSSMGDDETPKQNLKEAYFNGRLTFFFNDTATTEKQVDLGSFPYAVRNVNGNFYVTLLGENKLLVYSKNLNLLKTIPVGLTPQEMCSEGSLLYVVNTGSDSLSVINTSTNTLVRTISVAAKGSIFGTAPSACL